MAKDFALVVICGTGMGAVAIDNVSKGRDPIPAAMAGMVFTTGVILVQQIDEDIATALAALFLISVLLTRSSTVTNLFVSLASGGSTDDTGGVAKGAKRGHKSFPKN